MTAFDQRGISKLRVLVGLLVMAGAGRRLLLVHVSKWSYASGERRDGCRALEEGLDLQNVGRRDHADLDAGRVDREISLHRVGQEHREGDQQGDGPSRDLHYEQRVGLPTSCFGETRYYVTRVTIVEEIQLAPGVVVPTQPAPAAPPAPATPPAPVAPPK